MFLQGFTLIELLVVITIVGLLSALAIPAYDRYIIKTQVTGILAVANAYKVKLVEDVLDAVSVQDKVYNLDTDVIDNIKVITIDTEPKKHVIQVIAKMKTPTQVGIGLKQPKNINKALTLQLQGVHIGEVIAWSCHVHEEYNVYVPSNCRNYDIEDLRIA